MQTEAKERLAALEPLIDQAKRRAERTERLQAAGAVSKESWENARDAYTQLRSERVALQARLKSAEYEARAARAAIAATPGSRVALIAPVDGVVLRRFEEQERMAMAGTPVIEIGGMRGKELVIDVLSTDAVRIRTGMNVLIDGWGGERTLRAHVIRVEPAATIKVSALGVEEKRVNVIAALDDDDAALGDTYKVDANVVLWESPSAVTVPLGALVRTDRGWVVWVVTDNTVQKRDVTIGHRAALNAEVVKGLSVGETVVVHPPEALEEGSRVE
jgi:HlyD family secretion protein